MLPGDKILHRCKMLHENQNSLFLSNTHQNSSPKFLCLRHIPLQMIQTCLTFSDCEPVLDCVVHPPAIFSRVVADSWNFGLCATIPREPRQARKGATVTGQFRVPRSTRSSSHRPANEVEHPLI